MIPSDNKKKKAFIKKLIPFETHIAVFLVFVVTLIAYGLEIGDLGYYQDDWFLLWSAQGPGPESIVGLFSIDRPFMGYVNYVDYMILGDAVINWQVYALFWRVILGLGGLWLLRLLWRERKTETLIITLLMVVYPGFLSQPIAMNYKNYIFEYSIGLYSIIMMVYAFRAKGSLKRGFLIFGSVGLALFYVLLYEFMIGLEVFRILLLVYLVLENKGNLNGLSLKSTIKRVFSFWWSYVVVMGGFVYWRFFVFESARSAVNETALLENYKSNPIHSGLNFVIELGKDFFDVVFTAWALPWYRVLAVAENRDLAMALISAFVVIGLVFGYYYYIGKEEIYQDEEDQVFGKKLVFLGTFGVLGALTPVVFGGRQILFNGFERYGLHASLAVVLIVVGGMLFLRREVRIWAAVFLLLVGVSTHILNAKVWANKWALHKDVWQQLSWRAPQMEEGTVVIVYPYTSRFGQDYEMWGPLNMIYAPGQDEPYLMAEVLANRTIQYILEGEVHYDIFRNSVLTKDYQKVLLVSLPARGACLRVIDSNRPEFSENESAIVKLTAPYSSENWIITEGESPPLPENIFGEEPAHNWCYYYQQASLARQRGDWEAVIEIGDIVQEQKLSPSDRSEWMVFLEAYTVIGRFDDASELAQEIRKKTSFSRSMCSQLKYEPYISSYQEYDFIYSSLCGIE